MIFYKVSFNLLCIQHIVDFEGLKVGSEIPVYVFITNV